MNPQANPSADGGARIQGSGLYDNTSGPGPRLMTASTLTGDKVVNRSGDTLGEINEIMLDVPRGRVAYAVMSAGGVLGVGQKLFAIPWNAMVLDTDRHCFILDVPVERFKEAPGFDKDHWPEQADEQWHRDLHAYYRAPVYWE
ncbi:MAG: PRC-barrel domain-containing protein [Pseudomonadota bacterium]